MTLLSIFFQTTACPLSPINMSNFSCHGTALLETQTVDLKGSRNLMGMASVLFLFLVMVGVAH